MCKPIDNWGAPADFLQFQMDLGLEKKIETMRRKLLALRAPQIGNGL
jgi:hypothetical protein